MTKPRIALLGILFFTPFVHAQEQAKRWTISEKLPNGQVKVKVIEEDEHLRDDQRRISQRLLFKKTMTREQFSHFDGSRVPRKSGDLPQVGMPLWVPVKNVWTKTDEDAYSAWFASTVDENFVEGSGLMPDCADTGLLFRWVYARNNRLPIANTLSGSGKLFGHFSSSAEWDRLPQNPDWKKDERFKAALRFLFDNTYTLTVVADLAPTLVNPQYVRPGSMFMIIRPDSGHTQTILRVGQDGIDSIWGNEPGAETIYTSGLIIEFEQKETIGVWRTPRLVTTPAGPEWQLTPATEMPGYSLEQFQQDFPDASTFTVWLYLRLGVQVSDQDQLYSLVESFINGVKLRLKVTAEGLGACYFNACPVNGVDYGSYSTTVRDARLAGQQKGILSLIQKLGSDDGDVASVLAQVSGQGAIIQGTGLTYLSLLQDPALMGKLIADPHVSFAARWGLESSPGNINLDFLADVQAFAELMTDRDSLVYEDSDSTALDTEMRLLFTEITTATKDPAFLPSSMTGAQAYFSQLWLDSLSGVPICSGDDGGCSYNDAIWKSSPEDQVAKWVSKQGVGRRPVGVFKA